MEVLLNTCMLICIAVSGCVLGFKMQVPRHPGRISLMHCVKVLFSIRASFVCDNPGVPREPAELLKGHQYSGQVLDSRQLSCALCMQPMCPAVELSAVEQQCLIDTIFCLCKRCLYAFLTLMGNQLPVVQSTVD